MLCKEREEVVGDWASGLLMSKGWERRTAWMGGVLLSNNQLNMMAFFLSVSLLVFPNVCVVSFVLTIGGWKLTGLASPKQRGDGELVLSFSQCPGKKLDTSLSCPTIRVLTSFFLLFEKLSKKEICQPNILTLTTYRKKDTLLHSAILLVIALFESCLQCNLEHIWLQSRVCR